MADKQKQFQTEAGDFVQNRLSDPSCFPAVEIMTGLLLKFPVLDDLRMLGHIKTESDGAVDHLNLPECEGKSQTRVKIIHSQECVLK